jgi:hypothetical protein
MDVIELLDQQFFNDKPGSVLHDQSIDICHRLVSRHLQVQENTDTSYSDLQKFLTNYTTNNSLIIGNRYLVGSIIVLPTFNLIDWIETLTPVKLNKIEQGQLWFIINGKERQFPKKDKINNKQLRKTLVFTNQDDLDQFLTVIHTTFSKWKITKKILGPSNY